MRTLTAAALSTFVLLCQPVFANDFRASRVDEDGTVHAPALQPNGLQLHFRSSETPLPEYRKLFVGVENGNRKILIQNPDGTKTVSTMFYTDDMNYVRSSRGSSTPPTCYFRFPFTVGDTWGCRFTRVSDGKSKRRHLTVTVETRATHTTTAGEELDVFILKTKNQWSQANRPATERYAYSPKLGAIVWYRSQQFWDYTLTNYELP